MHNFRTLNVLDHFQSLFEKLNIDYPVLRHIIAIKLLMDRRRTVTLFGKTKKSKNSTLIKSFWIYFLYGLVLVFFVFGKAYMLQMSIIFGIALFILMTALIADFSSVMLDVRDRPIIGTKPVDQRTIGAAKFIHILIYILQITIAFTMISVIFMLFVQGFIFTILFMITLILFMLFIIAITAFMYLFVLKFFSGERLKSMINYVQISFAIGIIIGYQIIIRGYGLIDLNAAYTFKWWHSVLPPMWFAAPFELILNKDFSPEVIVLSLLACMIPLLSFLAYYWLIPVFEANLQKLLTTTDTKSKKVLRIENIWKWLLCRTEKNRAIFSFIYKIIDREREFKLKVYPSIGIGFVLPFIFIFSESGFRSFNEITDSSLYFSMYFMNIFIGIAIYTFQFSGSFKGAWIFTVSGSTTPSQLYGAVIKVFLVKLYLPMFTLVGITFYLLFHQFRIVDLAIVCVSAVLQILLSYKMTVISKFPFSLSFDKLETNESMTKMTLLMFLTVPFAIFHFLSTLSSFSLYAYFIFLIIITIYTWRKLLGDS